MINLKFLIQNLQMKNSLETNRIVTGSLFIIASIAVAFILNFAQPFLVPLVIALFNSYFN